MKIVVATSTFPASDTDEVPAFVKDQILHLKKRYKKIDIIVHAPHNHYSNTAKGRLGTKQFREVRYHYFFPFKWELLAGRGIMPALQKNKLLYMQIPFLVISQFFSLLRLIRKEKPDLIYAHWFTPQAITGALVSKLSHTTLIFTTHASDVAVLKRLPFSRIIVRWVCRRAHAYTAVSQRTADRLKSFFSINDWQKNFSQKLSIIPMGVDTQSVSVNNSDVTLFLNKHSISTKKQTIVFIGRLAQIKGINYLLDALALMPREYDNTIQLVIAGDGQEKKALEKQTKDLGLKNVKFVGYVQGTEKNALFSIAEMICIPSIVDDNGHMEGLPVVMMEGLAAGKIILASNVSGAEAILEDKKSGFLFAQRSASSLSSAIISASRLSFKEKSKMETEATKLAKQFDWSTITEKHYKLFKEALSE